MSVGPRPLVVQETQGEPVTKPHDAFISYSRKDAAFAAALETALEGFSPPRALDVPQRHLDVFRDTNDLTGTDYNDAIERHLRASRKLIVVCSPAARQSRFVNPEIEVFLRHHPATNLIPVILAGVANNEAAIPDDPQCAFPASLCQALVMPLAAEFRGFDEAVHRVDRPPFTQAWYTVLSNVYERSRSEIEQRVAARLARRRLIMAGAAAALVAVLSIALIVTLGFWRQAVDASALERTARQGETEARLAEKEQRVQAETSRDEALRLQRLALDAQAQAESRALAARSQARLANDDAIAAQLLAIEAGEKAATPEAGAALYVALQVSRSRALLRHDMTLHNALFTPDGRRVVTAGRSDIRVWDTHSAALVRRIQVANLFSISLTADGTALLTAERGRARLIDIRTGAERRSFDHGSDQVLFAALSPDQRTLVTTSGASAYLWQVESAQRLTDLWGHSGIVDRAAFSPDGRLLATTAGNANQVFLWDVETAAATRRSTPDASRGWVDTGGKAVGALFSPDGRWLVTASHMTGAQAWRVAEITRKNRPKPIPLHDRSVVEIAIARGTDYSVRLVTAGLDGRTRLHKVHDRLEFLAEITTTRLARDILDEPSSTFDSESEAGTSVSFDKTGTRLLTASGDGAVKLWSFTAGGVLSHERWQLDLRLRGHHDRVRAAAFSADGTRVVTVGSDGVAQIWDATPIPPGALDPKLPIADLLAAVRARLPANLTEEARSALTKD